MYLSSVRLDLNTLTRAELFDVLEGGAYTAHQLLWRLFPGVPSGKRPFIFRQEMEEDANGKSAGLPRFYVGSDRPPEPMEGFEIQCKPFAPRLASGERLAFRLRANPTVAKPAGTGRRSQRADVLMDARYPFPKGERTSQTCVEAMDAAARHWLDSRAKDCGFTLPVAPEVGAYRQHALSKKEGGQPIRYSSVDYEGLLEVVDPERLGQVLQYGIGRARAFGCGMLLLRRVPE
ncbi:type I-E CRISPR-associated protein Cas6/Cse3/CasE [Kushneria marisflavi]|uniref:Type I-E CRISPR-associated protein Cas6/Cse3/CasE n=1 Tax=Kushneria marisflavi TaxID=157779 RepID=A0A240UNN0_9GAMM|nr:type I-E CRISPR-associated protein Cas6/Cse3/CasE [Kushneria marisflavi]ART62736.1 type I-E CRISPR-associated protein Cas6/Cse3/CasE [Kushneria marisflavi]RKD83857.1 CRISPR-associated Cse3 family protein [Kushneria marisflavi]